jgi:UDP-N-acetylmuramate dehydrogenase
LAVPVNTRWFAEVNNDDDIAHALAFVREKQCPLLVLGGGSNVVLVDDFIGLTVHMNTRGVSIESETDTTVFLSVAAGENWHDTVMYCVAQSWCGIENLALIPGSVGAAPIQNIGAYGVELTQCFSYLEAIEISTGKLQRFDREACEFAYRDSVFKQQAKDQYVITRVVLALSKQPQWYICYPALQERLAMVSPSDLNSAIIAQAIIDIRRSKLPNPDDIPNAGSFFKNPIVSSECYYAIKRQYPQVVAYEQETQPQTYKLAAGWLLDHAGWKGTEVNGVAMHKDQALVLTNPQRLSGANLLAFVAQVTADIREKYTLELEVEPRIYTTQRAQ